MTSDKPENVRLLEAADRTVRAAHDVINRQDERIANQLRMLGIQRELLAEQAGLGWTLATALAGIFLAGALTSIAAGDAWWRVALDVAVALVAGRVALGLRADERAWRAGE